MVGSWGVAGDMVVIEWGEKSCKMEFEMNLENNFKLLSHHYSLHQLPSVSLLRLRTIKVIVNSRASQRRRFQSTGSEIRVQESLVYWKQRLATDRDCSTVVYILRESMVEVWENIWYVYVNSAE